ncbi:sensitivity to red-light reduced protein [Dissophora globulifera]|nr:sensitivity to red-light reduced protein [Dissophora globulifera]
MSTLQDLPKSAVLQDLDSPSTSPPATGPVEAAEEEPFTFVTRKKKNGRKQETSAKLPPSSLHQPALPKVSKEQDSGNLPGWTTTRKPTRIKKNSQRAKMLGWQEAGQGHRSIEWGLDMIEDRITTLKQSKFYEAFRDLVHLTLDPPCRKLEKAQETALTHNDPRLVVAHEPQEKLLSSDSNELCVLPTTTAGDCDHGFEFSNMICYGIGSIESSRNSQFQLALGICLKEILQISGTLSIYDPIMTDYDKQLVEKLGFSIISDEQSKCSIESATLLYMPHCPKGLYSRVLEINWTRKQLDKLVILGNRFTMYDESPSFRQLEKQAPFILPALTIASVSLLPKVKFEDNTVFNDMAFHLFPAHISIPTVDTSQQEEDPELL